MSTRTLSFTGRVGGVTYVDTELFDAAAHALGYRPKGARGKWAVGTEVALTIDGVRVAGQVWDRGPRKETYWVALEDGRYALLGARHHAVVSLVNAVGQSVGGKARIAS